VLGDRGRAGKQSVLFLKTTQERDDKDRAGTQPVLV